MLEEQLKTRHKSQVVAWRGCGCMGKCQGETARSYVPILLPWILRPTLAPPYWALLRPSPCSAAAGLSPEAPTSSCLGAPPGSTSPGSLLRLAVSNHFLKQQLPAAVTASGMAGSTPGSSTAETDTQGHLLSLALHSREHVPVWALSPSVDQL